MARTFVFGDVHGDLEALDVVLAALPPLEPDDALVFLGDYVDRGPDSAGVVARIRALTEEEGVPCPVVALRGNHEDAWLRVIERGWPEFVLPLQNGCLAALRSYRGEAPPSRGEAPSEEELETLLSGSFFPSGDVAWMQSLPFFHEDAHAIYVHAGLVRGADGFLHPAETEQRLALLWLRDRDFFRNYRGKLVVFGHTATSLLPEELSSFTPEDPDDLWAGPSAIGLDTGAGKGGFLTCLELPSRRVLTSPRRPEA